MKGKGTVQGVKGRKGLGWVASRLARRAWLGVGGRWQDGEEWRWG